MAKNLLTDNFLEPLNGETTAMFDIHAGDGNLIIDRLDGEQALASGTLQYFEKQGQPTRTRVSNNDQTTLAMRGVRAGQPWFHFPWTACNGATEWQIHLNPTVSCDIKAHSDGGNVKLNLAGMSVAHVSGDTGGGNMDVILPVNAANLSVDAKTGAGNVTVEIGSGTTGINIVNATSGAGSVVVLILQGIAARIQATSGMGKAIVDPQFSMTDQNLYQSSDFESAANKVEITAKSGMGNVRIISK